MITNLHLIMLAIKNMVGVYMNILGCSPIKNMVVIEFKIVKVHLNVSD